MADSSTDIRGRPAEAAHQGIEQVVSYCDGELSDAATTLFETHLAECSPCRQLLRTAERVFAEVDRIVDRPEPEWAREADHVIESLRAAQLEASRRQKAPPVRQPSQRFWLPLGVFGLVAVVIALVQLVLALRLPGPGGKPGVEPTVAVERASAIPTFDPSPLAR